MCEVSYPYKETIKFFTCNVRRDGGKFKENIIPYISVLTKDDTWGSYNVAVNIGTHLSEFRRSLLSPSTG